MTKHMTDDEFEITPEMIEAGVEELYSHPITEPNDEILVEAVKAVYCRMWEVLRQSSPVGSPERDRAKWPLRTFGGKPVPKMLTEDQKAALRKLTEKRFATAVAAPDPQSDERSSQHPAGSAARGS